MRKKEMLLACVLFALGSRRRDQFASERVILPPDEVIEDMTLRRRDLTLSILNAALQERWRAAGLQSH